MCLPANFAPRSQVVKIDDTVMVCVIVVISEARCETGSLTWGFCNQNSHRIGERTTIKVSFCQPNGICTSDISCKGCSRT